MGKMPKKPIALVAHPSPRLCFATLLRLTVSLAVTLPIGETQHGPPRDLASSKVCCQASIPRVPSESALLNRPLR